MEPFFTPKDTAYLAQVFNDATAEIINKHPGKLAGVGATLPLNNIDAALEGDR